MKKIPCDESTRASESWCAVAEPTRWFARPVRRPQARVRLLCFPHAGGSAQAFFEWPSGLPPEVDVWALSLPGRAERYAEPCLTSCASLVEVLASVTAPHLSLPYAFFGHSMGALLAFELARELRRRVLPAPAHLIVCGFVAPHLTNPEDFADYRLRETALIDRLRELGGTPPEVLANRELMAKCLPTVRADLAVCGSYSYRHEPPLSCPITAFGGREDAGVPLTALNAWSCHTSDQFRCRVFAGGHFFVESARPSLLQEIVAILRPLGVAFRGRKHDKSSIDYYNIFKG
jgi:surfactin synthase thioesterase subunit